MYIFIRPKAYWKYKGNSRKYKGNWTIFYSLNLRYQNELLTTLELQVGLYIGIYYFWHICHMLLSLYDINIRHLCHIWHMTKIPYVNMVVKIVVSSYTIQPPAPKLSNVHFNILNIKYKKIAQFPLYFMEFPVYFQYALGLMKINTKSNKTLFVLYQPITATKNLLIISLFNPSLTSYAWDIIGRVQ